MKTSSHTSTFWLVDSEFGWGETCSVQVIKGPSSWSTVDHQTVGGKETHGALLCGGAQNTREKRWVVWTRQLLGLGTLVPRWGLCFFWLLGSYNRQFPVSKLRAQAMYFTLFRVEVADQQRKLFKLFWWPKHSS
jgi:hypothetical protein